MQVAECVPFASKPDNASVALNVATIGVADHCLPPIVWSPLDDVALANVTDGAVLSIPIVYGPTPMLPARSLAVRLTLYSPSCENVIVPFANGWPDVDVPFTTPPPPSTVT